ncbi:MAG: hypothetical protein ACI30I_06180 [Parabacteroides sp.]
MYLELYKSIRSIVADAFGIEMDVDGRIIDTHESALKDIQWFASQYDGVIHTAPVLLVEFQDLDMSVLTKQTGRTHISIRLHVVTEAENESDGIPDRMGEPDHRNILAVQYIVRVAPELQTFLHNLLVFAAPLPAGGTPQQPFRVSPEDNAGTGDISAGAVIDPPAGSEGGGLHVTDG